MKKSETESAATDSPRGTDCNTENSATGSTEPIETIPRTELSGVVGRVIPLATPARSSPLSDADAVRTLRAINRVLRTDTGYDTCIERIEAIMAEHEHELPSPLSGDEEKQLARIARDRANRFMVASSDVDFLLDVIVRLSR